MVLNFCKSCAEDFISHIEAMAVNRKVGRHYEKFENYENCGIDMEPMQWHRLQKKNALNLLFVLGFPRKTDSVCFI